MFGPPLHPSATHYRLPHTSLQQEEEGEGEAQEHQRVSGTDHAHVDARVTAAAVTMHKQWDVKAASLLRGLELIQHCCAPDMCRNSLCRSTRRLLKTYATHLCPDRHIESRRDGHRSCRVCKLWHFLMRRQQVHKMHHALVQQQRGRGSRSTSARPCRWTPPSSHLVRRIIAATVENNAPDRLRRF